MIQSVITKAIIAFMVMVASVAVSGHICYMACNSGVNVCVWDCVAHSFATYIKPVEVISGKGLVARAKEFTKTYEGCSCFSSACSCSANEERGSPTEHIGRKDSVQIYNKCGSPINKFSN